MTQTNPASIQKHLTRILILFVFLLLFTIPVACSSSDDEDLEQTRIALAVQQTKLAETEAGIDSDTLAAAQQATLQAQVGTQTALTAGAAPDLASTQLAFEIQQTQIAIEATQAAQGTALAATQMALSVQQTVAASGSSQGAPSAPVATQPVGAAPVNPGGNITPVAGPGRPPEHLILYDDFSDHASWPVTNQSNYQTMYQGTFYIIQVTEPLMHALAYAGRYYPDTVIVDTTAQFLGTSISSDYGVICRYQDDNNFYYFSIQDGGNYIIGRYLNGINKLLGSGWPEFSPAINQGGPNRIVARCVGNELYMEINGVSVGMAFDNTFTGGDVGLYAGAGDDGYVSAGFDYISAEP